MDADDVLANDKRADRGRQLGRERIPVRVAANDGTQHVALLVASCVAFAPRRRASELLRWATDLRQQYRRRHAFREELARACESLGVLLPA